jgi:hypothetical protein
MFGNKLEYKVRVYKNGAPYTLGIGFSLACKACWVKVTDWKTLLAYYDLESSAIVKGLML